MTESKQRLFFRLLLGVFYMFAGIAHLRSPDGFLAITPGWVLFPQIIIALTGLAEVAGSIGLMVTRLRYAAGIGLALYAVCVWPANINHAVNDSAIGGRHLSWWYHGPRLALQPVIIWWALWVGGVTNWPFQKKS